MQETKMVRRLLIVLFFGISSGNLLNKPFEEFNFPSNFLNNVEESSMDDNTNISAQCKNHIKAYHDSLKLGEMWAMRMLDAGGKIPAGLLEGNVVDLGFFDECLKVEGGSSKSEKIFGKYCIGTIPVETILQYIPKPQRMKLNALQYDNPEHRMLTSTNEETGIHLATCMPDACSAIDIQQLYARYFKLANMTFKEELCQTKATQTQLDAGSIATLSFLGIILGIMVVSTAYDVTVHYLDCKSAHPLLIAFSVFTNGKKLLQTSNNPRQISCLHGIRVVSTMWVILGHRYMFQLSFPLLNSFKLIDFVNNAGNMFVFGATVSVDTFFLISGLVLVYVYMSALDNGLKFNIFSFYIHRYLRLTPVVAVTVLIHVTLLKHFGSGPLWPTTVQETLITACESNWWKALLYIQNYKQPEDMCVPQSWYLSVDMQLFLLSPILLIPLKIWPKFTLSLTGFLTFCSIASCFLTTWFLELGQNMAVTADPDRHTQHMKYYYLATWTRAAPWLIGFILGYIIYIVKQRKNKFVINKIVLLVLWVAAAAVLFTCVFAGHENFVGEYDKLQSSFHSALVRPSWAIAVGWVIFACVTGNGGPVDWFLSLPLFQVVSKITFTMYMVHYVIVFMIPAQMRSPPMFSNPHEMYVFWGDFAFTFAVALIFTLALESPFITIEKLLLGGEKKKTVQQPVVIQNQEKSAVA